MLRHVVYGGHHREIFCKIKVDFGKETKNARFPEPQRRAALK
jgi:hypothetical protein